MELAIKFHRKCDKILIQNPRNMVEMFVSSTENSSLEYQCRK